MFAAPRKIMFLAMPLCLAAFLYAHAQGNERNFNVSRSDHAIWVQIDSDPRGVDIYSIPLDGILAEGEESTGDAAEVEAAEPVKMGRTPCMIPIDFTWPKGLLGRKKWDQIKVWSAGGSCIPEYYEGDKSYSLYLVFSAEKRGYISEDFEMLIGTLTYPGVAWTDDDVKAWPREKRFKITLEKDPDANKRVVKKSIPVVVIADSESEGNLPLGTLMVEASVSGADVYVNNKLAGSAPINVVLREGEHIITVRKDGYKIYKTKAFVPGDKKSRLVADLSATN